VAGGSPSAGLLRTFGYLGAITSAAAQGGFYGRRADSTGLHHLALFLVVIGILFLLVNPAGPIATPHSSEGKHPLLSS
jgi:hypothetical protein